MFSSRERDWGLNMGKLKKELETDKETNNMPGNVQIFNTTRQPAILILNQHPLNLGPASKQPPYAPSYLPVERSVADSILMPVFARKNRLSVTFLGFYNDYEIKPLDPMTYDVQDDLSLYIFYEGIVLCDNSGKVIQKEFKK